MPVTIVEKTRTKDGVGTMAEQQCDLFATKSFSETNAKEDLQEIKVAILDTGIDLEHQEFYGVPVVGRSFVTGEAFYIDEDGHGTHYAGLVAGNTCGIAKGAQLYIGKVFGRHGDCHNLAEAIRWAAEHADIISMSLGDEYYDHDEHDAVLEALCKGKIVVCAAGNQGAVRRFNVAFPATIGSVIRVGGVNRRGRAADYPSVGGPEIDVVALGEGVWSAYVSKTENDVYQAVDGTSMATPQIAGACALLLAYDRYLAQEWAEYGLSKILSCHCMKHVLRTVCFNATKEKQNGHGSTQLLKALK